MSSDSNATALGVSATRASGSGAATSVSDRTELPDMNQHQMLAHQPGRQALDIRTVLVCDDRTEMRDAITGLLELLPDLKLVGSAADARACVAGVREFMGLLNPSRIGRIARDVKLTKYIEI